MHRSRRCATFVLAAFLVAALVAPAVLAAPATTAEEPAPASWWSWLTTPIAHVVDALGPSWEPEGGEEPVVDTTQETTDPALGDDNELGPGWEPMG